MVAYELLCRLARGGMGNVYLGRARATGRLVVLKRMRRVEDEVVLRDEAKIGALLRHPHVVPMTDVVSSKRKLTLVFDYVESLSLSELLTSAGRIPVAIAARIMIDALAGLHAAHQAGVIHRDVSPQNIIVGTDGQSRVIDFGIAKSDVRDTQTAPSVIKGKLRYMAPEQARQGEVDRRVDLYAAGVVLWESLTGRPLFQSTDPGDLLLSVLVGETLPPSAFDPALSCVDEVIAQSIATDRTQRFSTAKAQAVALTLSIEPAHPTTVATFVKHHGQARFQTLQQAELTRKRAKRARLHPKRAERAW